MMNNDDASKVVGLVALTATAAFSLYFSHITQKRLEAQN